MKSLKIIKQIIKQAGAVPKSGRAKSSDCVSFRLTLKKDKNIFIRSYQS